MTTLSTTGCAGRLTTRWGREDLCTVLAAAEGLQVLGLSRNRFDEDAVAALSLPI